MKVGVALSSYNTIRVRPQRNRQPLHKCQGHPNRRFLPDRFDWQVIPTAPFQMKRQKRLERLLPGRQAGNLNRAG